MLNLLFPAFFSFIHIYTHVQIFIKHGVFGITEYLAARIDPATLSNRLKASAIELVNYGDLYNRKFFSNDTVRVSLFPLYTLLETCD